ncbi:hypothetical protein [Bacillus sp. WP8]|nr:hypothetical protein [Bacillus sp. WP8]
MVDEWEISEESKRIDCRNDVEDKKDEYEDGDIKGEDESGEGFNGW